MLSYEFQKRMNTHNFSPATTTGAASYPSVFPIAPSTIPVTSIGGGGSGSRSQGDRNCRRSTITAVSDSELNEIAM